MSIGDWLKDSYLTLESANIPSGRLDAELILAHTLDRNRAWVLAHIDDDLDLDAKSTSDALLARRLDREPLVHLTGHREFYGLEFKITPDVLTPRVETEQMVEWAIKYAPQNSRLIDIGTGSGAIAIAIKHARPDITVTATEVTDEALQVARDNAIKLKTDIIFIKSDLWNEVSGQFETACTNLPYLKDEARAELIEEVKHEPDVALFGGPDGLDLYRRFLANLPAHLTPGGYLFTECDPWQQPDLTTEAARLGFRPIKQGYFIAGFQRK